MPVGVTSMTPKSSRYSTPSASHSSWIGRSSPAPPDTEAGFMLWFTTKSVTRPEERFTRCTRKPNPQMGHDRAELGHYDLI